ncbi:MAG TPA: prepilin-type N-terminal cleavage/methylation domain-containing protein [Candidatus Acidoferrum sp.]|nr:prepilin-type N-terminal cleavage/methylation domain-containing protein [Candidatus Acidoferrum sp.]
MVRSLHITKGAKVRARAARGFTLLELVVVVAIAMILAGLAVPVITNTLRVYKMRSGVTSVTSAISGTRYQAIFHGCKTQIIFTKSSYSYQVQSQQPAYGGQACLAAFANIGSAVPLNGQGIAIDQNVTLTFSPGGAVTSTPAMNPIQMVLTYPGFLTTVPQETIKVSNYGNITVTP